MIIPLLRHYTAGALTTGAWNVAVSHDALFLNVSGDDDTALGMGALYYNTASDNTADGKYPI